jgi:SAM-dependent methyltransferase
MKQFWLLGIFLLIFSCSQGSGEKKQPANEAADDPAVEKVEPAESEEISPEDSQRTEWQNPDLVLDMLGNLEGKTVADIGAGSGYFTFKIARRAKKVIALDIDPRALEYIEGQIEIVGEWSRNIETRLTPADVPNLLDSEADVALIVNTYGFIPDKETYIPRLLEGIKPGGILVIVDYKTGNIPVGPADGFKVKVREVTRMLKRAGFKKTEVDEESLEYQYIVTAKK